MKTMSSERLLAAGLLFAATAIPQAGTVFSDDFSSSTLNSATLVAPTDTATSYQIASTKNSGSASSITASQLRLGMPSTTSGLTQIQGLFTKTPIVLSATGHYLQLQATFTTAATALIEAGSSSSINFGLFNSAGVGPVAGGALANGGLTTTTGSTYDTGNAADWQGYVGRIRAGDSRVFTRPIQNGTDTTSESQDLLFDNVGGGAFDDPTGVTLGTTSSGLTLTAGSQYTYTLRLTLDAGTGFLTADEDLFAGAGTSGANLLNHTGNVSGSSSTPTLAFDGLAIGYRYALNPASGASAMDLNGVEVTTNVPEPGSAALLVAGLVLLGRATRRRRG